MKQLKLIALTALTILAVSGTVAATANAANPEFLGELPRQFTTAGLGSSFFKLAGHALVVECGPSEGTGELINNKNATFDELFLNCKSTALGVKVKCTGLNDTITGSILAKGTSTLGYELGTTNVLSLLTISPEIHFECSSLLVVVKGCFAGKTTPRNIETKEGKIVGNSPPIEDYTTDTGATAPCVLLGSENSKAFTLATEQVTTDLTFAKLIEIMA